MGLIEKYITERVQTYANKYGIPKAIDKYGIKKLEQRKILTKVPQSLLYSNEQFPTIFYKYYVDVEDGREVYKVHNDRMAGYIGELSRVYKDGKVLIKTKRETTQSKYLVNDIAFEEVYFLVNNVGYALTDEYSSATKVKSMLVLSNSEQDTEPNKAIVVFRDAKRVLTEYDIIKDIKEYNDKVIAIAGKIENGEYKYGIVNINKDGYITQEVDCVYDEITINYKNGLYDCKTIKKDFLYAVPETRHSCDV